MDLRISPCTIPSVCESYSCNSFSKFIVARHDVDLSIKLSTGHRFCEDCARNLAANLPIELSGLEADVQELIRKDERGKVEAEIMAELQEAKRQADINAKLYEKVIRLQAEAEVKQVKQLEPEAAPEEEEPEEDQVFRCLDCNLDLKNKTELRRHKAEHKKAELAKGKG